MDFYPYRTRSGYVLLGATVLSGLITAMMFDMLLRQQTPPQMFQALLGLLVLAALSLTALYWTVAVFTLRYHLNRNGLIISWGLGQQRIPFNRIEQIVPGHTITEPATFNGLNLAGLRFGRGRMANLGPLKFWATSPLPQSMLIVTPGQTYVISPSQPAGLLQAWQARRSLGPTQQWAEEIHRRWPLNLTILSDRVARWLLGAAALLLLALLGYISLNYLNIPPSISIHFNSLGQVDLMASKPFVFLLPAVGAMIWGLNLIIGSTIYRYEKMGTYLLWGSTIAVQLGLWGAALTIIGQS
jgi:hypothetical protein